MAFVTPTETELRAMSPERRARWDVVIALRQFRVESNIHDELTHDDHRGFDAWLREYATVDFSLARVRASLRPPVAPAV